MKKYLGGGLKPQISPLGVPLMIGTPIQRSKKRIKYLFYSIVFYTFN